jgi:hypothetical protein
LDGLRSSGASFPGLGRTDDVSGLLECEWPRRLLWGWREVEASAEGSSALPLTVEVSRLWTVDVGVLLVTRRSSGDARVWCDVEIGSSGTRGIGEDWTGPDLMV